MGQLYKDKNVGVLELPNGYTSASLLSASSLYRLMKGFLEKIGLCPIKGRKQLDDLRDDALIYALIGGGRRKADLIDYLITGYIAQKKDFKMSQHLSKPQTASSYPITLEYPERLILVKDGIVNPNVFFRRRRDGELMRDVNSCEVRYYQVSDWIGKLFI